MKVYKLLLDFSLGRVIFAIIIIKKFIDVYIFHSVLSLKYMLL